MNSFQFGTASLFGVDNTRGGSGKNDDNEDGENGTDVNRVATAAVEGTETDQALSGG